MRGMTACVSGSACLDIWGPRWRFFTPPGGVTGGSDMPFTPDSRLPATYEEVERRALRSSPEAAGADPCMGLSERASASEPGEVPTAQINLNNDFLPVGT